MNFLIFFIFPFVVHAECRFTAIPSNQINSQVLEQTLLRWQKKDPRASTDDLICCLPEDWRSNYIVVPESHSLQCSGSKFPRVILFDPGQKNPLTTAISFVGPVVGPSDCQSKFSSANNFRHIEMMEFRGQNPTQEMFQFVDLENGGTPVRKVNPFVCVDCHRTVDGMRPFAKDLGAQFSNLGGFSLEKCLSPQEKNQQNLWAADFETLTSQKKQKPYSCLLERKNGTFETKNDEFVTRLTLSQNFHIAARIKKSPEYAKYKSSILAATLGCAVSPNHFEDFLPNPSLSPLFLPIADIEAKPETLRCQAEDGLCGKAIPENCQGLTALLNQNIKVARTKRPAKYGELLAQNFFDQGRNAAQNSDSTERFTQLQYLMSLQKNSANLGLDQLIKEYPGPRAVNFEHLAGLLLKADGEFAKLPPKDDRDAFCKALQSLVRLPSPK